MLTIRAQVDVSEEDRMILSSVGKLEDEKARKKKEKSDDDLLKDRGRALDQVKRLYAVVMGFAITCAITGAVTCIRKLPWSMSSWDVYLVLASQVFILLSLLSLFFLAAERILDRRYLQKNRVTPTWRLFLLDLITIGGPAIIFLVIGNTFPTYSDWANVAEMRSATATTFWWFTSSLLLLYVVDVALLVIHGIRLRAEGLALAADKREEVEDLRRHYRFWIVSNAISAVVVAVALYCLNHYPLAGGLPSAVPVACSLAALHLLRFLADFSWTFSSYFPTKPFEVLD